MFTTLMIIAVLILTAMVLVIVEVCTPTLGLVGAMALASAGGAIYLAWTISPVFGMVLLVACILIAPLYIVAAVRILPRTALGRRMYLHRDAVPPGEGTPEANELEQLVGRTATAETYLRPSGAIRIDGRRVIAQAESGMIDRGEQVRIIKAAGNRVIVQRIQ